MSNDSKKGFFGTYMGGVKSGVGGILSSVGNVFSPRNYSAANRQFQDFKHVVKNPRASGQAASDAFEEAKAEGMDPALTLAKTAGEWTGAAVTVAALSIPATLALRRPYLATQVGKGAMRRVNKLPKMQSHPKIARFLATRPLSMATGAVIGGAAFVGGAQDRADTAEDNKEEHPRVSKALETARMEELAATPVSRIVNNKPTSNVEDKH